MTVLVGAQFPLSVMAKLDVENLSCVWKLPQFATAFTVIHDSVLMNLE